MNLTVGLFPIFHRAFVIAFCHAGVAVCDVKKPGSLVYPLPVGEVSLSNTLISFIFPMNWRFIRILPSRLGSELLFSNGVPILVARMKLRLVLHIQCIKSKYSPVLYCTLVQKKFHFVSVGTSGACRGFGVFVICSVCPIRRRCRGDPGSFKPCTVSVGAGILPKKMGDLISAIQYSGSCNRRPVSSLAAVHGFGPSISSIYLSTGCFLRIRDSDPVLLVERPMPTRFGHVAPWVITAIQYCSYAGLYRFPMQLQLQPQVLDDAVLMRLFDRRALEYLVPSLLARHYNTIQNITVQHVLWYLWHPPAPCIKYNIGVYLTAHFGHQSIVILYASPILGREVPCTTRARWKRSMNMLAGGGV